MSQHASLHSFNCRGSSGRDSASASASDSDSDRDSNCPDSNCPDSNNMAHRALLRPVRLAPSFPLARPCLSAARPFSTVIDAPISPAEQRTPPAAPAAPSSSGSVFSDAVQATGPRTNWTKEQISEVYNTPLIELTYGAVSTLEDDAMCRF